VANGAGLSQPQRPGRLNPSCSSIAIPFQRRQSISVIVKLEHGIGDYSVLLTLTGLEFFTKGINLASERAKFLHHDILGLLESLHRSLKRSLFPLNMDEHSHRAINNFWLIGHVLPSPEIDQFPEMVVPHQFVNQWGAHDRP
jgi:hypothetical protein